jgi:hypothetical protein
MTESLKEFEDRLRTASPDDLTEIAVRVAERVMNGGDQPR